MATKLLKNNTAGVVSLNDITYDVPTEGYTIPETSYHRFASSSDLITALSGATPDLTLNDGGVDLSLSDAVNHLKNIYPTDIDIHPFTLSEFDAAYDATTGTATKTTSTNIDFKLPADLYLSGGEILTDGNAVFGDWVQCQIIDIDDILGYGPNTILKDYVVKYYIDKNARMVITINYAGKVLKDLYIRIIYHSIGTANDVGISINYYLHKLI